MFRWAFAILLLSSVGASALLLRQNRALERRLSERVGTVATTCDGPSPGSGDGAIDALAVRAPALARMARRIEIAGARGSTAVARAPHESRAERWQDIKQEIGAVFGRDPDETDEEYRERVVPLVKQGLAPARERATAQRDEIEALANVTAEQREQIDVAINDAYQEALALTNRAIASGEINPYKLEWNNALAYAGGLGAILDSTKSRFGDILTEDQQAVFADNGFEWSRYLGVNMPWETLDPPPALLGPDAATPVAPE